MLELAAFRVTAPRSDVYAALRQDLTAAPASASPITVAQLRTMQLPGLDAFSGASPLFLYVLERTVTDNEDAEMWIKTVHRNDPYVCTLLINNQACVRLWYCRRAHLLSSV